MNGKRLEKHRLRLEKYRQQLSNQMPLIGRRVQRKAAEALVRDGSPEAIRVLAEALLFTFDKQAADIMLEAL